MAFEIFSRKVRRLASPQVTLTTLGRIALNKAATVILEKQAVENVILLWDIETKRFAIRPISKKDSRAYRVHYGKKGNGAGFSAVTFLDHIGYNGRNESRSFSADWNEEEGMFLVSMADEVLGQKQLPLTAVDGGKKGKTA
ncbi:MAG: hypothetical protein Q8N47_03355 [Bryobacterales bacterium]|nr:hypothetical protein [Bryobacterales bacterium]